MENDNQPKKKLPARAPPQRPLPNKGKKAPAVPPRKRAPSPRKKLDDRQVFEPLPPNVSIRDLIADDNEDGEGGDFDFYYDDEEYYVEEEGEEYEGEGFGEEVNEKEENRSSEKEDSVLKVDSPTRKLPPMPSSKTMPGLSTVWDCRYETNGGGNGIMVSMSSSVAVFLDEKIQRKFDNESEFDLKFVQVFRGPLTKIIEFLPPEQSSKLSKAVVELNKVKEMLPGNESTKKGKQRKKRRKGPKTKTDESKRTRNYHNILKKAAKMDFSEFERMKVLRLNIGVDKYKRPVVLFKERNFSKEQLERLLYYFLHKLDPITNTEYVLVWCIYNSRRKGEKIEKPGLQWLLTAYRSLSRKVRKNLKSLYLIHPTLLYSVIIKFFRPFVSKKFWKKLHLCNTVQDVEKYELEIKECPLPPTTCAYNIEKFKEKCVFPMFDVTINDVYQRRENKGREIPLFLDKCLDYIEENTSVEGIFRKAGNKLRINDLKKSFDHGYNVDIHHCDVHTVTGTVKQWFREMKEPIVPFNLYEEFLSLDPNNFESVKSSWLKLPPRNKIIAQRIFLFLQKISGLKDQNKMDSMNLAIVFGPNVLRSNSSDRMKILKDSERIMNLVNVIVSDADKIFGD